MNVRETTVRQSVHTGTVTNYSHSLFSSIFLSQWVPMAVPDHSAGNLSVDKATKKSELWKLRAQITSDDSGSQVLLSQLAVAPEASQGDSELLSPDTVRGSIPVCRPWLGPPSPATG